jgi:hypothetical protein
MEIAYAMNPNTTPVATIASNFCQWIMNGDDEAGNSVNCDYFGVEDPGRMYTLDKDSVPGSGSISCADVFAIHGWWMVAHFKNIAVWEYSCPTVPDIAFTTYRSIMMKMDEDAEDLAEQMSGFAMIIQCCYSTMFPSPGQPKNG